MSRFLKLVLPLIVISGIFFWWQCKPEEESVNRNEEKDTLKLSHAKEGAISQKVDKVELKIPKLSPEALKQKNQIENELKLEEKCKLSLKMNPEEAVNLVFNTL